jgi:hypothetical protein
MLKNFLTDELTLAVAVGGEPNRLGGAQCLANRFELACFLPAHSRTSAIKALWPQKDRRPALPGRHNILRLEQIQQMTLSREDYAVAGTNSGANVIRLTGFLRDDDLIAHDRSFGRIESTATREHTENDKVSQAAFDAIAFRLLEACSG